MLTKFIETPEIRQAFKENSVRVKLPSDLEGAQPTIVPIATNRSLVGTSFDYMARWRLARAINIEMADMDIPVLDSGWVAEQSLDEMARDPRFSRHHPKWSRIVMAARQLHEDFVFGREGDLVKVAKCVQCLGALDLLTRIGGFKPDFMPLPDVTEELLSLDSVYDPLGSFNPRALCLLNPALPAAEPIGGGDADIVVDNMVVDIKTTADISSGSPMIRQLSSYAVLLRRGGTLIDQETPTRLNIDTVGLYFARYGRVVSWHLDEIFPDGGLERFGDALMEGIQDNKTPQRGIGMR